MSAFPVNKGVGKSVEFKGLRAQYVIYAVVGIVLSFVVFFVFSFIIGQLAALIVGLVSMIVSVCAVVYMNGKFGEHGLSKYYAAKALPRRIAYNRRLYRIVQSKDDED